MLCQPPLEVVDPSEPPVDAPTRWQKDTVQYRIVHMAMSVARMWEQAGQTWRTSLRTEYADEKEHNHLRK